VIAGCANNQLEHPGVGARLAERRILYAPDFVINAGGMIRLAAEIEGWDDPRLHRTIEGIGATLTRVFVLAHSQGISTSEAADRVAQERLHAKVGI
jgi:leucine dehydrogenase